MPDQPALQLIPPDDAGKYREGDAVVNPRAQFDDSTMYVLPQPITTASEDRQGEIIRPEGGILAMHKANPVVCWQHSHQLFPDVHPIARAEKPDGTYDVFERDGVLYSGCTFQQVTKLAYQTYALIREGIIRARSIGAIGHRLKEYTPQSPGEVMYEGRIVPARSKSIIYELWELLEWSWVIIPANRDITMAIKSYLSKPKYGVHRLDPFLEHTLKSLATPEPLQVPGFDFTSKRFGEVDLKVPTQLCTGVHTMKGAAFVLFDVKTITPGAAKAFLQSNPDLVDAPIRYDAVSKSLKAVQVDYDGPVDLRPVDGVPGVTVAIIKCDQPQNQTPMAKSGEPTMPVVPVAPTSTVAEAAKDLTEGAVEAPEIEVEEVLPEFVGKPGSRLLQALNAYLNDGIQMLTAAITEQEDVPARAAAEGALAALQELQVTIADAHDAEYPDGAKLVKAAAAAETDGETPDATNGSETAMKSLIAKFYRTNAKVSVAPAVAKALRFALKQLPESKETAPGRTVIAQMLKGVVTDVDGPAAANKAVDPAREKLAQRLRRLELQGRLKGLVPQDQD